MWHNGSGEKRLHVLMQKVHTIRNDKNKKRKEAHAQSLAEQAKRFAKKAESLDEVPLSRASTPSSLCRVHLVHLVYVACF
jgi:hypothetical protein